MLSDSRVMVLKLLLHVIFFLSGVGAVLIGQVLPFLASHFKLTDLEMGYFFPSQFAGSLLGSYTTSFFAKRDKYMSASIIGGIAMGLGVLLLNGNTYGICVAGFFVNGLGIGLTLPAINMMIIEVNPTRTGQALSILNLCWGIGAILCKPFVDYFSEVDSIVFMTTLLAGPLLGASTFLAITARRPTPPNMESADSEPVPDVPIWRMPIAWAIAFFNFIHVGFESGMGGWLTTYTGRVEGEPFVQWLSPTLLYFLFFVIGRGTAPILFRFLDENKMLFLGLAVMMIGVSLTLLANTVAALSVGAAVSGFGTSWIFPTNVSRFSRTFGPAANRRAVPLFMAGTLGAATVTWLIGYLSDSTGDLRSGMFVLGLSVAVLVILQSALSLRSRRKAAALQIE